MFRGYLRWVVVTLVAIATVINYVDRNALAIMWVEIGPELGMNSTTHGWSWSSWSVTPSARPCSARSST